MNLGAAGAGKDSAAVARVRLSRQCRATWTMAGSEEDAEELLLLLTLTPDSTPAANRTGAPRTLRSVAAEALGAQLRKAGV